MRKIAALLRHRQTPPPAQPSLAILAILAILALGPLGSWRPGVLASWRPGVLASWRAKKDLRPRRHPPEADAKNPRWAEILLQISDLAEGVIHALRVRWPQSAARTNPNLRRDEANAWDHAPSGTAEIRDQRSEIRDQRSEIGLKREGAR